MGFCEVVRAYLNSADDFDTIAGYKDAETQASICREKAESARKDAICLSTQSYMDQKSESS